MAYCGERNKKTIWYANYIGDEYITDESGYKTGEHKPKYTKPIKYRINVSGAKNRMDRLASSTYIEPYGIELGYNKVLTTSDANHGIGDAAVLWIDTPPVLDASGNTTTPYDYYVVQVNEAINNYRIAVKKVDIS